MSFSVFKAVLRPVVAPARAWAAAARLPVVAKDARKAARARDRWDPGPQAAIRMGLEWLALAQDNSASADGGAARDYSLLKGWASSYPETTGYIIPTLLDQARRTGDLALADRAKRMLDWLVEIQFEDGGFQGGVIGQTPKVPVIFNTGQILMGLAAGAVLYGAPYDAAMAKAADWLADAQDPDGCWRAHRTPFATQDDKAYETHVAWGLLEAARVSPNDRWSGAALKQVDWAVSRQLDNGWMQNCCLSDPENPLTHTLGYALRGILEAWRFSQDQRYLEAGTRLAEGLLTGLASDGFLPGRFDSKWRPRADWCCLTGTVQIAHCWLMLHEDGGDPRWLNAARAANAFVRSRLDAEAPPERCGAVAGAWPLDGDYCAYEYPNWAAKFMIDSCQLELDALARAAAPTAQEPLTGDLDQAGVEKRDQPKPQTALQTQGITQNGLEESA